MRTLKIFAAALSGLLLAFSVAAETATLTFVLTGDIYELDSSKGRGGMAKLSTVVQQQRAKGEHVLFVHAGDTFSPSLLSGFTKGKQMVEIFNAMGLDYMVLGNHEWDFGNEVLHERIWEANFPIITSNVLDEDGLAIDGTSNTAMVTVGPFRVGILGIVTPNTKVISSPGDMEFLPSVETTKKFAKQLRNQGANLVVALAHLDYLEDLDVLNDSGVDVLLSGHDHYKITWDNKRSVWMESGEDAENVAVMDITLESYEKRGRQRFRWEAAMRMIDTKGVEGDPAIAKLVKGYEDFLSKELDVDIGQTHVELDSRRKSVRSEETVIGNVIADAMRESTGSDVCITSGGGIRGNKLYDAGAMLTRRDILTELPFGNVTVKLELSGQQIREALENGLSQVEESAGRFPASFRDGVHVELQGASGTASRQRHGGRKAARQRAQVHPRHQRLHGRWW
jgi:2',3'-cyclic-nucleotide 2'-phosphodiesterase (5'-nucleotidase family)